MPLPPGVHPKNGRHYLIRQNRWIGLTRIDAGELACWRAYYRVVGYDPSLMSGVLLAYLEHGTGDLAPITRAKYEQAILTRLIPYCGHMPPDTLEPTHVAQFLLERKKAGAAIAANRERAALSSACNYAMGQGWMKFNPCFGVRRNKERPAKRYVEHEELTQAIDKAPRALGNLIAVAYLWGARQTDLRALTWAQVQKARDGWVHLTESKTQKPRAHEITATVRRFLERAAAHREAIAKQHEKRDRGEKAAAVRAQPYVFLTSRGLPWGEWALQSAMRRLKVGFSFRTLRPKAETDKPGTLGHTGQMQRTYTRRERLKAVK